MSSMLSTGVSGLVALQTALDTTSHNISNSSTVGYSRQSVTMSENQPELLGGSWLGNGVRVTDVRRAYDDIVAGQVRSASSGQSQWTTYSSLADQVNNLFSSSSGGLSTNLQSLASAFQSVANSPASSPERQVLLSKAQALASQLQTYGTQLTQINGQVSTQLDNEASAINGLATSIANVNAQITAAAGRGGNSPNDLIDQRDNLIDQLSTHVNVSTVKNATGGVDVFIGSGQALVLGGTASSIATQADSYDPSRRSIVLTTGTNNVDITSSLSGGTVGGLLDFRSQMLDPAKNYLGQVTLGVADVINQQQHAGLDLTGSLGTDLFAVGGVGVLGNSKNTGSGTVDVTRDNTTPGALTLSDYVLTKTGSGWSLTRSDNGQAVTMTGAGTSGNPFVADGLQFVVGGSAATGDKFLIRPTADAAAGAKVLISDPSKIAAAAAVIGAASTSNTGTGTITKGVVTDATNANLLTTATITFASPPTSYSINGGASVAYTAGQAINLNGWQVAISGAPAAGDTFTVKSNAGGTGDNRNALLMANVLGNKSLNNGTSSINDVVGSWVADIGVKSSQAQANLATQTSVYNDAYSTQQSVSGVNLDEEAANMIRYQQAYAATAKVIATSNTLFQALLQAVG